MQMETKSIQIVYVVVTPVALICLHLRYNAATKQHAKSTAITFGVYSTPFLKL
jgi:hypothetical protein